MYRINAQDGSTALIRAARNGRDVCTAILLVNGAEVNMAKEVNKKH